MIRLMVRLLILFIILLTSSEGLCESPAYLDDIKIDDKNNSTSEQSSIILSTSKNITYKWAQLKGKVYIDLKNTELRNIDCKPISVDDQIIKLIRCSQFDPTTVRIVFEVDKYKECKVTKGQDTNKLEIIFSNYHNAKSKSEPQIIVKNDSKVEPKVIRNNGRKTRQTLQLVKSELPKQKQDIIIETKITKKVDIETEQNIEQKIRQRVRQKSEKRVVEKDRVKPTQKIVVIDPGHGGNDPGAISSSGLEEKSLTLDISLRLAKILKEKYDLKVYLTRYKDRYIALDRRTAIANDKNADVFVSVHVNASDRPVLSGLETFLLSWSDDKEALIVAARENQISINTLKKESSDLGIILSSLAREGKRDESLKLTHLIHSAMLTKIRSNYTDVNDLGVRKALFYVLVGASMPSALVEVGYITNSKEEKRLQTKAYREDIAISIARGIYKYISTLPDEPKYAQMVSTK